MHEKTPRASPLANTPWTVHNLENGVGSEEIEKFLHEYIKVIATCYH